MPAARFYSSTAAETTITAPIDAAVTVFSVTATTGFPLQYPFTLALDADSETEELVDVTNVSGNTVTATRGVDGTTAVSHSTGAKVKHVASARDHRESREHEATSSGVHGVAGALVGTTDVATLENKTISGANNTISNVPQASVTGLVTALATHTTDIDALESLHATDVAALDTRVDALEADVPSVQIFTISGTWNKPAGLRAVIVEVVGGGGSAGGSAATGAGESTCSGGGGGGGYARKLILAAALGVSEAVSVGAGGAGAAAGNVGNPGGTSSFGAHCSALGGGGGDQGISTSGTNRRDGGAGGNGSGGNVNIQGDAGGVGCVVSASIVKTNVGGGTFMAGTTSPDAAGGTSGHPGKQYGGGSSGVSEGFSGPGHASAAGADGVVIVYQIF